MEFLSPAVGGARPSNSNTSLEDVDLDVLRGSSYLVTKHVNPAAVVALQTRVLFLPFFREFWLRTLGWLGWLLCAAVWVTHAVVVVQWALSDSAVSGFEVFHPVVAFLMTAFLYGRVNSGRFPELVPATATDGSDLSSDSDTDADDPNSSSEDEDEAGVTETSHMDMSPLPARPNTSIGFATSDDDDDADDPLSMDTPLDNGAHPLRPGRLTVPPRHPNSGESAAAAPNSLLAFAFSRSESHEDLAQEREATKLRAEEFAATAMETPLSTTSQGQPNMAPNATETPRVVGTPLPSPVRRPPIAVSVKATLWRDGMVEKAELSFAQLCVRIMDKVMVVSAKHKLLNLAPLCSLVLASIPTVFDAFHTHNGLPVLEAVAGDMGALHELVTWRLAVSVSSFAASVSVLHFFVGMLSIAEQSYSRRYLCAKYFAALTSARRAQRFNLPHFRLHKISNIKVWLSLRSFLKKQGSRKGVDDVVSLCFQLSFACVVIMMLLQVKTAGPDLSTPGTLDFSLRLAYWLVLAWCVLVAYHLLRFMSLGTAIVKKYGNASVLLTEQINLYLRMVRAPHKKQELAIANSVLKLAQKLLKELEQPKKISGFSVSPMLLSLTRVVVLSAASAVLSDILGFNLRLWKVKV